MTSGDGDHAPFAPSAAHRWLRCPGSLRYPDQGSGPAAREGTFAHHYAAMMLTRWRETREVPSFVGETDGEFTVSDEMHEHLVGYVAYIAGIIEAREAQGMTLVSLDIENRLRITSDVWGTGDAVLIFDRCIDVVDLKYGIAVRVDVERNEQLMLYGAGALRLVGETLGGIAQIEEITIHIVQPRYCGNTSWTINPGRLREWVSIKVVGVVRKTREVTPEKAERVAGDHCRWCPGLGTCEVRRERALEIAADVFKPIEQDETPPPKPEEFCPAELARLMKLFPQVEAWMKAVREHAHNVARGGQEVTGFALFRQQGNRQWVDEGLAEAMLKGKLPEGVETRKPGALLSPAQAEKHLTRLDKGLVEMLTFRSDNGTALRDAKSRGTRIESVAPFKPIENENEKKKDD